MNFKIDKTDGILQITINRPHAMNAMMQKMWHELADHLRDAENDAAVRCVVLTGAGDHFCAGGDVKEFSTTTSMSADERSAYWSRQGEQNNALFQVMERIPQPIVARVNGVAAGGGMAIVAAADLVVASRKSRFFAAQIKVGVIPDSALSYNLARAIGPKRAKQLCLLGETIGAETALEFGLVNWVVPVEQLDEKLDEVVKELVGGPKEAMRRTKRAINIAHRISVADHLNQECVDIGAVVAEQEFVDRVSAFMTRKR